MIKDLMGLKGHVAVEKNGILVVEKNNLVVLTGREWVAARFNLEGNGSSSNAAYDQDLDGTNGIGNRTNGDIHYMSIGSGDKAGNSALLDANGAAFPVGRGVYADTGQAYAAVDPEEIDVDLQNEVDRVELGTMDAVGPDSKYYGGFVMGDKVQYVAEFWPDTRFGTPMGMQEGQFQPIVEAGLHCHGLDLSGAADYETDTGRSAVLCNSSFSQPVDDRMVARVIFPVISKGPLDMIRITWTITVGG